MRWQVVVAVVATGYLGLYCGARHLIHRDGDRKACVLMFRWSERFPDLAAAIDVVYVPVAKLDYHLSGTDFSFQRLKRRNSRSGAYDFRDFWAAMELDGQIPFVQQPVDPAPR